MKDGLFKRCFSIFLTTLIGCTLFLGVAMLTFSGVNYTSQKQQLLESAASKAAEQASGSWNGTAFRYVEVRTLLLQTASDYGVDVYITDIDGNIICCSEKDCHHGPSAPPKALKSAKKNGEYSSGAYLKGLLGRDADYVTGIPVEAGGEYVGFVFATTSIKPLLSYLYETMFTYLFSGGIMLLVAFIVIYTATMQLTAPLQEMSSAAERFGRGDFDARVKVEGDDEIAVLAKSFNQMAESLSEFEKNRRSFVANVSHDLRTPMTTIGGYIDGILDGTIPREQQDTYLEIVSQEVKRLSRLTSSLLQVMKLEENRNEDIELVSVDAREILINILFNMEQRIEEKKIHIPDLELPDLLYVKANKDMLHQVIYNLLDNAVKYTPEEGEIEIKASDDGNRTVMSIRNTGKGIAKEEQASIFERFYKTDKSRGIDKSGTGLGLYIVKMLTTGMGGTVEVDSDGETYTCFTVTLDTAPAPVNLVAPKQPREKPQKEEQPAEKKLSWSMLNPFRKKDGRKKTEEKKQ